MSANKFNIGIEPGSLTVGNRGVQGRVVLSIDGTQVEIERVTLDSERSRSRVAKRWAHDFGLDEKEVRAELTRVCLNAVAEHIQRAARNRQESKQAERVSTIADRFIEKVIDPQWHREGKSVYGAAIKREVPVGSLWTFADDAWIDEVARSKEARESSRDGVLSYRAAVGLFRDALSMAATRAIGKLPENKKIDNDQTVDHDELLEELVGWLLKERSIRTDTRIPVTTTIYDFACGVDPAAAWRRCYSLPVFARIDKQTGRPMVAVKGAMLKTDLKRESTNKLVADLTAAGLAADIDHTVKVEGKVYRAWLLSQRVLDRVATPDGGNADTGTKAAASEGSPGTGDGGNANEP